MASKRRSSPLGNPVENTKKQKTSEEKGKQVAGRPYATTFRICDIDIKISRPQLLQYVEERFLSDTEPDIPRNNVRSLSLAPSPADHDRYQIATITFDRVPPGLARTLHARSCESFQIPPGNSTSRTYFDSGFIGLTPLNDDGNMAFDVDLIFVTGLAGHAFGSWKASNSYTMWIRDFLAPDIKYGESIRVRVLTYGYESRLQSSTSAAGILEFAQGLLESLTNARRLHDQQERPIVFVAHSLGGIVVKKALVQASRGNENQKRAFRATYALIYLGVPNRGMSNDELKQMVKGQPNETLVSDLGTGSQTLTELHNVFSRIFHKDSQVISLYETQLSKTVQISENRQWSREGERRLMVSRQSATGSAYTELSSDQFSRDVDHSALAKFSNRDQDYINLRGRIFDCISRSVGAVGDRFRRNVSVIEPGTTSSTFNELYQLEFELVFPKNLTFTGREDILSMLHERILEGASKVVVLYGLGGVGKTNIALEYAYRYQRSFTSVFWVNGSSEETTVQGFRSITERLIYHYAQQAIDTMPNYSRIAFDLRLAGLIDGNGRLSLDEGSTERIISSVKRWFNRQDNQRWLLILDNVDDLDSFKIDSFIPTCCHGKIIITSRRERADWLPIAIRLDEMTPEDASNLLLKIARLNAGSLAQDGKSIHSALWDIILTSGYTDSQAVTELIQKLGNLPLAIVQAGAYISSCQIPVRSYLEIFEKQFESLFSELPPGSGYTQRDRTIFTTWQTSFEAIKKISSEASSLLMLCSFLSNADIWEFIIRHGKKLDDDDTTLHRSLQLLFSYSLAQRKGRTDSFYIHPLVHRWGHERLKTGEKIKLLKEAVLLLRNAISHTKRHINTQWHHQSRMLAHVEVIRSHMERYQVLQTLAENDNTFLDDVEFICEIYSKLGYWKNAHSILADILEVRKRFNPGFNVDTVATMSRLATNLSNIGQYREALVLKLQVVEARRELLGDLHPDTVSAMANLNSTNHSLGRFKEAEEIELEVLRRRRELLGDLHPDTLSAMANLAATYHGLGRFKQSEEMELQVLKARRELLGDLHPDTVYTMGNLALAYSSLGKNKEAEEMKLQVLEARRELLGDQHPVTIFAMASLAATYHSLGRFKEAEEMKLQVLKARREILGDLHPDTVFAMSNLAVTYGSLGRFKEAEEMKLQVLKIRRELLGERHTETIRATSNLAITYRSLGRRKEAEEMQLQVLEQRKGMGNIILTSAAMYNLAVTYCMQGRWKEAESLARPVLETQRIELGTEHQETLAAMSCVALISSELGDLEEAEDMLSTALQRQRTLLGNSNGDTLNSMRRMSSIYVKQGRLEHAEALALEATETSGRVLGEQHPDTLTYTHDLANICRAAGQLDRAESLFRTVLEGRKKAIGNQHPDTIETAAELSRTYKLLGKDKESADLLAEYGLETHDTETPITEVSAAEEGCADMSLS